MKINALAAGVAAVSAALVLASAASQAQGRWQLIGTQSIGFQIDRDRISVRGDARFTAIRVCVAGAPVHFRDADVVFTNGQRQDLRIDARVQPGQCSRNLDLRGEARAIREVVMIYNAVPTFRGRATVSVYGLAAPAPAPAGRWETIGTRTVGFRVDRDTISGRDEGRFRAIRLCAAGSAIHILDLDVKFGDGKRQDLAVRSQINPGQCTRPLDLTGGSRSIRRVQIVYRANPSFRGQAVLTLQGLH